MGVSKYVFVLLAFVLASPLAYDAFAGRKLKPDPLRALKDLVYSEPEQFVAIGSSRFETGLAPAEFGNRATVWAIHFMDIEMMDLIVRRHAEVLGRSRMVILEYYPEMLFIQTIRREPSVRYSLQALEVSTWSPGLLFDPELWRVDVLLPGLARARLLPRQHVERLRDPRAFAETDPLAGRGFHANSARSSEAQLKNVSEAYFGRLRSIYDQAALEDGASRLREMIEFLKASEIRFCFLEMPRAREFRALIGPEWAEKAAREVPGLGEFGCISREELAKFEDSAVYVDPSHLSESSALDFSRAVFERVR